MKPSPRLPSILLSALALISPCFAEDHARPLSLAEARAIAIAKHPKITVAELQALAARQLVRQAKAALYPTISGNTGVTAVSDANNTKVVSLGLPLSSVYNRGSVSVIATQLITDFGHTSNLIESTRFHADALAKSLQATEAQITIDVDGAYFASLQAQALLKVAEDTVTTRQLTRDQVGALAQNKLKSELDLSFAEVNLQDAMLLRSKSQNDLQASFAGLAALLNEPETSSYAISEKHSSAQLPTSIDALTAAALQNRPELVQLGLERESAVKYSKAQRALDYPNISLQGTAGVMPYHSSSLNQNYAAGGIVINVPIFTGGLNDALQKEANLKVATADALIRDQIVAIERDVRVAWLNMKNAEERVGITEKLATQAAKSLDLAKARYDAGTSSIVEFSQAQLNKTSADIDQTSARYELMLRRSILSYQIGNIYTGKNSRH